MCDNESAQIPRPAVRRAGDRARVDRIFGDVVPSVTQDERPDTGGREEGSNGDGWLRDQVPPHHGG